MSLEQPADNYEDYTVNYTENGTPRADSEARRQWNYICPIESCAQRFNRPCRLETHMRSHTNERPFACSESGCEKTFPRKDHLRRHLKNAHGDPTVERTFLCDWHGCSKSFTSNARLQRHMDVHESKFYCTKYPPCTEVFRKAKLLEAHIQSRHLEVKPHPCTFVNAETGTNCTAGYQTEVALRRHINTAHAEVLGDGHFCMLCMPVDAIPEEVMTEPWGSMAVPAQPLSFPTQQELTAHIEECHPPTCAECGQDFKNAWTLKSHIQTAHAHPMEQPKYPCPQPGCSSVFNRKHNLHVHVQAVHEKQAKYFCTADALSSSRHEDLKSWNGENACGTAFKAKASLDQHVRTHHLGLGNRKERRKAAKSKKKPAPSMLTLLTGVGYEEDREVPCLVKTCDYRFYMDRDLRRHLRSTHSLSEAEVEEMMQEREAIAGGRFWIGGLDEHMDTFESAEPSVPPTPAPYYTQGGVPLPSGGEYAIAIDPRLGYFDQQFDDMALLDEDAEMDKVMGLDALPAALDIQHGLAWAFQPQP